MLCRIVAVVGLMAAVGAADAQAATTRYVATPAHGGSDAGSNNCATSSSPCATIRQAVTKAASGDTIKIGPGDFPEAVSATTKALTFLGAGSGTQTDFNSATQTEIDASTLNKIALTFGSKNETIEGLRVAGGQHTNNYQALSDPGASTPPTLTVSHCVLLQGTVVPNGSVEGPVANLGGSGTGVTASFVDSVAVGIINAVVDLASVGSLTAEHSLFSGGIGNSHPDITFTASALDTAVNTTVVGSVLRASSALITNAKSTTVLRSNIEASGAGVILNDGGNAPMLAMRDSIIGPGAGTLTEGVLVVPNGADTEVPSVNLTFDTVLARQNGQALALDVSQADLGTHVNTENTILRSIDTSGGSGNDDIATGTQALNWNINYTDYTQTSGVGVPVPGSGTNFDVQPHFVDDDGSNLRLSSTSTLFDKGNPAAVNQGETDITGAPRSLAHTCGGAALPDVGAFEAPAPGSCPPPTATLTTPANGATYTQGQSVKAAYSCGAPPAPATLAACVGAAADGTAVANGAAIDTSTPGSYTFTVTATANDGATAAEALARRDQGLAQDVRGRRQGRDDREGQAQEEATGRHDVQLQAEHGGDAQAGLCQGHRRPEGQGQAQDEVRRADRAQQARAIVQVEQGRGQDHARGPCGDRQDHLPGPGLEEPQARPGHLHSHDHRERPGRRVP
jgi:hypothetical protein